MQHSRMRFFRLLVVLAALGLLAGACGSDSGDSGGSGGGSGGGSTASSDGGDGGGGTSDEGEPIRGGTLRAHQVSDADTLDPLSTASYNVHYRVGLASSRLLKPSMDPQYDYGEAPMVGDLAEEWEISDDLLTYTFHLRDNVFWHDIAPVSGRKFVADDVVATFEAIQERGFQKYMLENVISIEAPDDLTVVLKLSEPFTPLLNYMGSHHMWIIPREGIEGEYDISKQTIGTGPFVMTKWEQNITTEYERNPNYFEEGIPYIDGVTWPVIADQGARSAAFRAGELDIVGAMTPREYESLQAAVKGSVLVKEIGTAPIRLYVNMEKEPFDDIRVRKAMNMALDRVGMGDALYMDGRYTGPVNAHIVRFALSSDELAEYYPYDPDEAKKLLAEAGYPDGFATTMMVTAGYGQTVVSGAEWVVEDLKAIGITADIDMVDYATYITQRWPQKQYDIAVGLQTPFQEADEWLRTQYYSEGARNWYGINDPELDDMIMEQTHIVDEDERIEAVKDIQRYILENVVNPMELWIGDGVGLLSPVVKGYHTQPQYGYNHYAYLWLDRS